MNQTLHGHVIIVMGPTGSGKGTLMRYVRNNVPDLYQTVSCTTRSPRPNEVDGVDYHFISHADFQKKIDAGEFLEWAVFSGNRYGTLRSEILPRLEAGQLVLTEIEIQGVEQLKSILPASAMTVVYIEAGDWSVLRSRALARSPISEAELAKRKERYDIETQAKQIADVIIDNTADDFTPACEEFTYLIKNVQQASS